MKRTRYCWFVFLFLFVAACGETSDPDSLPNRPSIFGPASQTTTDTTLHVQPPAGDQTQHPLQIDAMRALSYPGSDIIIEAVLDPGVNYNRYYVSYLSEGLKIYALMTVPMGNRPPTGWPVIVFNHGYIPPDVYRTTERYIAYMDEIAKSGYIVFRSDYRGHDRSEGTAGGGYTQPNYAVDVLNAVASVKRHPDADPNRIGMWGHSMGGYLTLRAMVISGDIKAGSIWAGVVAPYPDLFLRWNPGAQWTTPAPGSWVSSMERSYGSLETNPDFWRSISANSYIADLNGPIQIHHGTSDHDVPWEFSQMLYDELQNASQMSELHLYKGDNHNISVNFNLAMQRTLDFFDKYVKNR